MGYTYYAIEIDNNGVPSVIAHSGGVGDFVETVRRTRTWINNQAECNKFLHTARLARVQGTQRFESGDDLLYVQVNQGKSKQR